MGGKKSKPWKDICSPRCWIAKGEVCRCKCKGTNHGKGSDLVDSEKEVKVQKK